MVGMDKISSIEQCLMHPKQIAQETKHQILQLALEQTLAHTTIHSKQY
jgi:hypothetical protein